MDAVDTAWSSRLGFPLSRVSAVVVTTDRLMAGPFVARTHGRRQNDPGREKSGFPIQGIYLFHPIRSAAPPRVEYYIIYTIFSRLVLHLPL